MCTKISTSLGLLLVLLTVLAAVPISISDNEKQDDIVFNSTLSTESLVSKVNFMWTIKNLYLSDFVTGQLLSSSPFSTGTTDNNNYCEWYLRLYPKGLNERFKDDVSLFIYPVSCDVSAKVSFGFINADNYKTNRRAFVHKFSKKISWGYFQFLKQDFLIDKANNLLMNDVLTIFCDIEII